MQFAEKRRQIAEAMALAHRVFVTVVRDRPCVAAIPAPRFCGAAATPVNYLPTDPTVPIVTNETFRKSL
jgi:hypothetical protein